ncbi:Mannose-1-phosphate guanylyltransferase 1 [bioreactor metagenome]|uniref:Mannose-1-phosphate guanylyltransferase 1 n=1 Tax=bioreactor metagenome TaxID=1076179 RepID=A0A644ZTN2_9ZZZZ
MNIILLSGGSGKRLWPLSNEVRSKQFLKLLRDENGQLQSMIQRVYNQLCQCNMAENVLVATGKAHVNNIQTQLGDGVKLVIEPERRDTFPAIALASAYLAWKEKRPLNEAAVVLPVDPFAKIGYFEAARSAGEAVEKDICELMLMGAKPTVPTIKYGYMVPSGEIADGVLGIERFYEKPDIETARMLIDNNALWHCGVFAFKLEYVTDILKKQYGFTTYEEVYENYNMLKKTSFDYAVVENAPSMATVVYDGIWKDLGTWNTLTEEMGAESLGNVIMGEETENTNVVNELDIPLVVLGTKNLVIAASPDGILVTDKEKSSYMKPYVDKLDRRPMYEERVWGEYKVLGYDSYKNGQDSLTKHMLIKAGQAISYQRHTHRDEIWTFVDGTGDLLIDGHIRNVRRGDVAYITAGMMHSIRAITDLHFVEVQIGTELIEEDVERFQWTW